MPVNRRPLELHYLYAQRRETEQRRAEEAKLRADFYTQGNAAKYHELWTGSEYYEKAKKDAQLLMEKKIRAEKLEERRIKLEKMLYEENLQLQQELKDLTSKTKLYSNGSYFNTSKCDTSNMNHGIVDKEEELKQHEAELISYHRKSYENSSRRPTLKTAWMERVVEKEIQEKKQAEATRENINKKEAYLKQQIEREENKLKEREQHIQDLKKCLDDKISELSEAENVAVVLRKEEDRLRTTLNILRSIKQERDDAIASLSRENRTALVKHILHRYRLKLGVAHAARETQLETGIVNKLKGVLMEEVQSGNLHPSFAKRLSTVEAALSEHANMDRQRKTLIDSMLDGEAAQIVKKQHILWSKESAERKTKMEEFLSSLISRYEGELEKSRERQREGVLERERILDSIEERDRAMRQEGTHSEVSTTKSTEVGSLKRVRSELEKLQIEKSKLDNDI